MLKLFRLIPFSSFPLLEIGVWLKFVRVGCGLDAAISCKLWFSFALNHSEISTVFGRNFGVFLFLAFTCACCYLIEGHKCPCFFRVRRGVCIFKKGLLWPGPGVVHLASGQSSLRRRYEIDRSRRLGNG